MPETVNYRATSAYVSKTIIVNVLLGVVAILALPEVVGILPVTVLPIIAAVTPIVNVILRMMTVRPVSFMLKPGDTKAVPVKKLK